MDLIDALTSFSWLFVFFLLLALLLTAIRKDLD